MTNSTLKVFLSMILVGVFSLQLSFAEGTKILADPTLPITFEDPSITYSPRGFGDANFNPIPTDIIVNPDMSGINMSDSVWMVTKTMGAQVWAGAAIDLADTIDLSMGTVISVKVWSPRAGITVRLKTEDTKGPLDGNGNPTIFSEVDATTTVASAWETLTFDLSTAPTYSAGHSYSNIVLFPDFNVAGGAADETFYFDDIAQEGTAPPAMMRPTMPITFEEMNTNYELAGFGAADFGPIPAAIIANPDMTGNMSDSVLSVTKTAGAQVWAGASMRLADTIDLAAGTVISVKVWSPRAGVTIRFKTEDKDGPLDGNGNPTIFSEVDASTTVASAWETLTFDLATAPTYDAGHSYSNVVLFPDFNVMGGAADETFYFDDVMKAGSNPPAAAKPTLPMDFEGMGIDHSPRGFGAADFGAIPTAIIENPDKSGFNTSDSVWSVTKTAGAQVWAGAAIDLADTLDLGVGTEFSVMVWSPRAGVTIRLKTEDTKGPLDGNNNPTIFSEVDATTTVASGWEKLTFDLSTAPTFDAGHSYSNIVLFPDFNVMGGAADETFYFDNIINENAVSIDPELFAGSKFSVYPNPTASSINISYHLPLAGDVSFTVMDVMGRKVAQVAGDFKVLGDHEVSIGAESLQNGTYILIMQLDGETVKHSKVIVNK